MTPKQEQFVREFIVDLNATQAAIRAGYSEATAKEQAHRLMRTPEIIDAIAEAKAERSELTQITAAFVLQRLTEEVQADLADLYDSAGNLLPVSDWPLIWRRGLVAGVDVEVVGSDDDSPTVRVKKIRVSDRVRRLELLGKHIDVKAFQENISAKVQHSTDIADRLQRAIDGHKDEQARVDEAYRTGRAVPSAPVAPSRPVQPAVVPAEPEPPAERSAGSIRQPEAMPEAIAAVIGAVPPAPAPYVPMWPQQQTFADDDTGFLGDYR